MESSPKDEPIGFQRLPLYIREGLISVLGMKPNDGNLESLLLSFDLNTEINIEVTKEKEHTQKIVCLAKILFSEFQRWQVGYTKDQTPLSLTNIDFGEKLRVKAQKLINEDLIKTQSALGRKNFYEAICQIAFKEKFQLEIPTTIVVGGSENLPCKLWSDSNGIVHAQEVSWEKLLNVISEIHLEQDRPDFPASILKKIKIGGENSEISQLEFYLKDQADKAFWSINGSSFTDTLVVCQGYINPRSRSVSKIRVHFTKKSMKIYKILKRNQETEVKEVERIVPHCIVKWMSALKQPDFISINPIRDINKVKIFIREAISISDFFSSAASELKQSCLSTRREHYRGLEYYFSKKKRYFTQLLLSLTQDISKTSKIPLNTFSTQFSEKFTVKFKSKQKVDVFEVNASSQKKRFFYIEKNLMQILNRCLKNSAISELVADFMEDENKSMRFIKLHQLKLQARSSLSCIQSRPVKHLSIYSETKTTQNSYKKVCCGDYCNLLGESKLSRDSLDVVMKEHPEYTKILYELSGLQEMLQSDPLLHIINRNIRPPTPIGSVEHKILRRTIINDRYNPESIEAELSTMTPQVLQELNITTESFLLPEKNEEEESKKLEWEYELIPVCELCYKVYKKVSLAESFSPVSESVAPVAPLNMSSLLKYENYKAKILPRSKKMIKLNMKISEGLHEKLRKKVELEKDKTTWNMKKTFSYQKSKKSTLKKKLSYQQEEFSRTFVDLAPRESDIVYSTYITRCCSKFELVRKLIKK